MRENGTSFSKILNQGPTPGQVELGPNPFLQVGVPVFVASLGILMCGLLMFLPSKNNTLKLAGLMVLVTDAATAVLLSKIFGSQKVLADASGITLGNAFGSKTIAWKDIASYNRVAFRGDVQFRVYDSNGDQLGRWSGYLGTREGRDQLTALLDSKTGAAV